MTSDFKDKLLAWLTGNYTTQSGIDVPEFSDVEKTTNNFETDFNTLFANGYFVSGALQGQDANNNGVGFTVMYGLYFTDALQTQIKGFIVILDEDFDIVQVITNYSSGTDFGNFEIMTVGDDGNFYAIENVNGTLRFVMLNNIIAKLPTELNYKVVLRKSYNLTGQSANIIQFTSLIKAPERSRYLIVGINGSQKAIATELVVQVGASNIWTDYTYTTQMFTGGDCFASWDADDNLIFKVAGFVMTNYTDLTAGILTGDSNGGTTMSLATYGATITDATAFNVRQINLTTAYYSVLSTTDYVTGSLQLFSIISGVTTTIKSLTTQFDDQAGIMLYKVGQELFYCYDYEASSSDPWSVIVGKIVGNTAYEKVVDDTFVSRANLSMWNVSKQFNLYNYYVQIGDEVYNIKQIYNSLNFNGQAYTGTNSMISNSVTLLSNGIVIFARNLYNRIVNNNTTIAIVNVPNNFINGVAIDTENLYSKCNNLIVQESENITTNIYEELMFNFVNTITMRNANDNNNIIYNDAGATRLNVSATNPDILDYADAKATKCIIHYADNTTDVISVSWASVSNYYQCQFALFVQKAVNNIQIISEDEQTIYQTITYPFEIGKLYTISQDVWCNNKI